MYIIFLTYLILFVFSSRYISCVWCISSITCKSHTFSSPWKLILLNSFLCALTYNSSRGLCLKRVRIPLVYTLKIKICLIKNLVALYNLTTGTAHSEERCSRAAKHIYQTLWRWVEPFICSIAYRGLRDHRFFHVCRCVFGVRYLLQCSEYNRYFKLCSTWIFSFQTDR